jgi:hypothetical protein
LRSWLFPNKQYPQTVTQRTGNEYRRADAQRFQQAEQRRQPKEPPPSQAFDRFEPGPAKK